MKRKGTTNILDGYVPEDQFARDNNITRRTVAEYRKRPNGLPFAVWAGRIYIPVDKARDYLAARVRHPNPRT
jgi:hypothetical protein